jgi:spermidine synthase
MLLLFVGSGCSALIYEIVWLQMLQLVIGSSAISLGVLLGTFMGGMCLGSLLLPRLVSVDRHPLRVYAFLEFGIAVSALALLFGMPAIGRLYVASVGYGLPGMLLRAVVSILCLILPTMLMGATLPAIARWVETTPRGVSWLGFFYGGNISGAVCGCLLAGFYLLRLYDVATATYFSAALNLAVAIVALGLAFRVPYRKPSERETDGPLPAARVKIVYIVIALSGLTALGAEVVWTRLLALMLGPTVYTFSLILAVFLVGLGIGSSLGALLARTVRKPVALLGGCQLLLAAAIAWTAYAISGSLPYWPIDPGISLSPWYTFQLDLARCAWAILPATVLWGASFPLALAAAAAPGQDPGRLVGGVYAANTLGAILGAVVFSLVLIPCIGTAWAQRVLIGACTISGLLSWALPGPVARSDASTRVNTGIPRWYTALGMASAVVIAVVLAASVSAIPWGAVAFGRLSATWMGRLAPNLVEEKDVPVRNSADLSLSEIARGGPDHYCLYVGEGMNVSVAVVKTTDGYRQFHGAGKVQATSAPSDMRLQRMLGHLPALIHKNPESVLVVALGAGVTAGSYVPYESVKRIVICDIEPLVPKHVAPMFAKENYDVVRDPRTTMVVDDGRHFIETTREKFDIITSDPIDPWVKGCAALNTVEYYEMCKSHLKPGGVIALWIPFYQGNLDSAKSVIATFFRVFPHGILWTNDQLYGGYDAVLFGQVEPTRINVDEMRLWLDGHPSVKRSLVEVGFGESEEEGHQLLRRDVVVDLLSTYAGQASRLQKWMDGAEINSDCNLRLQYLAGMWVNTDSGREILKDILGHCDFPADLFQASDGRLWALKQALEDRGRINRARSTVISTPPDQ